jgi:hypothetical protein
MSLRVRWRRAPVLAVAPLAAALLAIACRGDVTGVQPPPLDVVTAIISGPTSSIATTADGVMIECIVGLSVTPKGTGTGKWVDGVMRFYAGTNRSAPIDSVPMSKVEVDEAWGNEIRAGSASNADWRFSAPLPFEVEIEFRFMADGSSSTSTTKKRFACGPLPPPGAVAPPAVTQFTVAPTTGELQRGDALEITYAANSSWGLWETTIEISGPFTMKQAVAENGASSASRTVRLQVPPGAVRGVPIAVSIRTLDAGYQQGTRSVLTQTVVVDNIAPSIEMAMLPGGSYNALAGQFAVGDGVQLYVSAADNDILSWLVWELGAPANVRDSIAAPPNQTSAVWNAMLMVKPEWVGSPILSLYVRDAAGHKSATLGSAPDSLRFYPLVTRPTATTPPPTVNSYNDLNEIAYDPKRNLFFIPSALGSSITVLDATTMTYRTPIAVPAVPGGIDLTPGGDSLIVALPSVRSLAVVDLSQPAVVTSISLAAILDSAGASYPSAPTAPSIVRVAANGKVLVSLVNRTSSGDWMLEVNLGTLRQRIRTEARGMPYTMNATIASPDRSRIAQWDVSCSRFYVAATDAFSPCAVNYAAVFQPRHIAFDAAGSRMSLGNVAFDADFKLLREGRIFSSLPVGTISADGAYLYLGLFGGVTKMRIADGAMLERFNVPVTPQRLFASPTGNWLMVLDGTMRAARIDLR